MRKKIAPWLSRFFIMGLVLTFTYACEDEDETPTPPSPTGTFADIDGNIYEYITIGDQNWMIQNLRVTRYLNGDPINNGNTSEAEPPAWVSGQQYASNDYVIYDGKVYRCVNANSDETFEANKWNETTKNNYWWTIQSEGAYCVYEGDNENREKFGLLYNWHAVGDPRGIAPEGWRVPTAADWNALLEYLGGADVAGEKLKEWGHDNWLEPNYADNESGFTALPGGVRFGHTAAAPNPNVQGLYRFINSQSYYWEAAQANATNGWTRVLYYGNIGVARANIAKTIGVSVRLVSDVNPVTK